jgi:tetratricopeptide (TPR) repeat protein
MPFSPSRAEPAPSLLRHLLIPVSLVACFGLVYWAHVDILWVVALVAVPMMVLYVWAPLVGKGSLERFDRDAVRLLSTGNERELGARLRQAVGMRLFAPAALVSERRGLVAAENGRSEEALAAYEDAVDGYEDGTVPLGVRLGLAHACYALGRDELAVRHYEAILEQAGGLPRVRNNLAHALVRGGKDIERGIELAEGASDEGGSVGRAQLVLIRALGAAKLGRRDRARALRAEVTDPGDPALEALAQEVDEALRQKKVKKKPKAGGRAKS